MKITKRQLRQVIYEELSRDNPIHTYSREDLLEEGLLDFIKGLFGKLTGWLSGKIDDALSSAVSDYKAAANDLGEVDPDKSEDLTKLFKAVAPLQMEHMGEAFDKLKKATEVDDWTPASDSDEDMKKWQEKEGEKSLGLWEATGITQGMLQFWAEYVPKIAGNLKTDTPEDPAGACARIVENCGMLLQLYGGAAKEVSWIEKVNAPKFINSVKKVAEALGPKIGASVKEQQKEWVDLRCTVGAIISEQKV